jgi:RND family efflux transporter MFP subunit
MAPILEIRVKAGANVQQGDLLVVLDDRDVQSRLEQAKAALTAARASLVQAQNDHQRNKKLFADNAIPRTEFEASQTGLEVAQAQVRQAEEAVQEAEVNLSYTKIEATRSGMIVDRLAEPGDIARPGVPLLVLYDPASLRLEVPVMENLALKLKVGSELPVHIDSTGEDVQGVVDEIVPQAETASRSFLVKVAIPRSDQLYENMFGRLRIPAGSRPHLCLPTAAIQHVGQNEFVELVAPDGTVSRRFIQTGQIGQPGRVEVLSGLKAGDRVLMPRSASTDSAGA